MLSPIHCNKENTMYPIRVEYVVKEIDDENDPVIRKIQELCIDLKIDFHIREFDSINYDEDRQHITRLPAIQIYEKDLHSQTIFTNERPALAIRQTYDKLELEYLSRLAKKQIWDEKFKYLKRIFLKKSSLKTDSVDSKTTL